MNHCRGLTDAVILDRYRELAAELIKDEADT
jgi:hypothetical protein